MMAAFRLVRSVLCPSGRMSYFGSTWVLTRCGEQGKHLLPVASIAFDAATYPTPEIGNVHLGKVL